MRVFVVERHASRRERKGPFGAGDWRAERRGARPARAEKKARATRDAATAGPPPARAGEPETASRGREVVEPQIMTRRMLRELAMRRGVSYAEMLAKAEAEGVELPEE